jgi:hypothetical protein
MEICAQFTALALMTAEETSAPLPAPPRYASFNMRMAASALDLGCVILVTSSLLQTLVDSIFPPIDPEPLAALNAIHDKVQFVIAVWKVYREQHILERMLVSNLLQVACIAAYTLPFWFHYSSTPGKLLFGMEIQDARTGQRMTHKQAILRFVGYIFSALPFTLGFVCVLVTKKRRGLHDFLAGTVVVVKPKDKTKKPADEKSLT